MKKIQAPLISEKNSSTIDLNSVVFSQHLNPKALAQVIRVYQANSHQKTKKTKTRSEVTGSTRKIYRQKGTGGARHGSNKAPIFVGGGVALGPSGEKPQKLHLSQKLRAKALASVLTEKVENKKLYTIEFPEFKKPSTTKISHFLETNQLRGKLLLIYSELDTSNLLLSVRNLSLVTLISASDINAYHVFIANSLLITPTALKTIETRIIPLIKN